MLLHISFLILILFGTNFLGQVLKILEIGFQYHHPTRHKLTAETIHAVSGSN